jgi:lysyl-tRNA synthetase class 2
VTDWRPQATPATLALRARLLREVREFFHARGVLEVDTPLLAHAPVTDPHLASLCTRFGSPPTLLYLQTSPEYAMKRLLAAGSGDIYQVCKAFRDDETGRHHNPEFTLIEWYRHGFDHHALMHEVDALLQRLLGARLTAPTEWLTYREAFLRELGVDPLTAPLTELVALAVREAGASPGIGADGRDSVLDLLMGIRVGPNLGRGRLAFVHEYPASQAALARVLPGTPAVAARFEAYVEGIELCNGFHELADAAEQRRRFACDLESRARLGLPAVPVDERLLGALEAGLPDMAGVAVGFDRVVMLAADLRELGEAMAFPLPRA